jgi:hypothetical protein
MPIRVVRDSSSQEEQPRVPDLPSIVVEKSVNKTVSIKEKSPVGPKAEVGVHPGPASWALVSCQCTITGMSYQLAFRQQGKTYVLQSPNQSSAQGVSQDTNSIPGPFNWQAFVCLGCGVTWAGGPNPELPFPVVKCTCGSLFCTSKGLQKQRTVKGSGDEIWKWKCPRCGIDEEVRRNLNSITGQAMKGK